MLMTTLRFGFYYSQTIYTRKENIDFNLPWFHSFSHISLLSHISSYIYIYIPKVIENDRQTADLFLQCFRENYRKRTKCICSLPYLFLFIVFYIHEYERTRAHLVYTRLKDFFPRYFSLVVLHTSIWL